MYEEQFSKICESEKTSQVQWVDSMVVRQGDLSVTGSWSWSYLSL